MKVTDIVKRNNVRILGQGQKTLMFAHGFGCNQSMWNALVACFEDNYKIVLFDYVGSGHSNIAEFDVEKYARLEGYAEDILDICDALALENVHLVGHSVSSIIGLLAAKAQPQRFSSLTMVCPSPCFLNLPDEGYFGGFEREDLVELLDLMDSNYIGWANYLGPVITAQSADEAVTDVFINSFCSTDPVCAKVFAEATFLSDYRSELPGSQIPVLILQSENDALASTQVGTYMQAQLANAVLNVLPCKGHAIHMTDASLTAQSMAEFYANRF
ncbi:alpha/beta fold hydrolase [Marinomonas sp. IMCC 4694]|uniref:alpha/beta fold hydrolase n=1 Tax=Marinomonas sp. IMCC 4694 TaxID=2605432 RepID=UPI0011E60B8F|nr:alpha/beta hydrolase [Marinomonas sp. IMCC 4694]TYL47555.1 alpha/beta hydrolase [Marinomonas sp. IMCC 4694]